MSVGGAEEEEPSPLVAEVAEPLLPSSQGGSAAGVVSHGGGAAALSSQGGGAGAAFSSQGGWAAWVGVDVEPPEEPPEEPPKSEPRPEPPHKNGRKVALAADKANAVANKAEYHMVVVVVDD